MSGLVALSCRTGITSQNFVKDLFWLTFYHQHIAQGYGGLATLDADNPGDILIRTHRGMFRQNFCTDLNGFSVTLGIGAISQARQPIMVRESCFPFPFTLAFDGNISNSQTLKRYLISQGNSFQTAEDSELMAKVLASYRYSAGLSTDENMLKAFGHASELITGSFAVVILTPEKVYVARSLDGHKQLVIGQKDGRVAIASETSGFYVTGFQYVRDVQAGEVLTLNNGEIISLGFMCQEDDISEERCPGKPCIFDGFYYCNPPSFVFGTTGAEFRRRSGALVARKDYNNGFIPDVVIPVPDSGRFHALGYYQEMRRLFFKGNIKSCPYYDEQLIKYPYASRSFTPAEQVLRDLEAQIKIIPEVEESLIQIRSGLVVVIFDDSLVRGTQMSNELLPKTRQLGYQRIHARFGYPKITSPCPWARSTRDYKELAAVDPLDHHVRSDQEIAEWLGIDSVGFNDVVDLPALVGLAENEFCSDCARR